VKGIVFSFLKGHFHGVFLRFSFGNPHFFLLPETNLIFFRNIKQQTWTRSGRMGTLPINTVEFAYVVTLTGLEKVTN